MNARPATPSPAVPAPARHNPARLAVAADEGKAGGGRTGRKHQPRVSRPYRSGTFIFLGLSLLVGGVIAAVAFSRTEIAVTLESRQITETASVTMSEQPLEGSDELAGKLIITTIEGNTESAVPQTGAVVEDYARGEVTITNVWTKTQPLAATTRLRALSNGLIFRTTKRVDVPAGGAVTVEVVADDKGERGNIPPDRFEIVALWPGVKDKIYGQSAASMSGGTRSEAVVTQALINDAKEKLEGELLKKAQTDATAPPLGMSIVGQPKIATATLTPSVSPDEAVPTFMVKGSVGVVQVAVDDAAAANKIAAILQTAQSKDEEVSAPSIKPTWKIIAFNEPGGTAQLELSVSARALLKRDSERLKPERFTRKTRDEIRQTLLGTAGVKSADVRMSPFWTTRSPSLPSQIKVSMIVQE